MNSFVLMVFHDGGGVYEIAALGLAAVLLEGGRVFPMAGWPIGRSGRGGVR